MWLLFADADDYFLEGFYDTLKKYMDTDYDIVFFPPISRQLETGEPDIRRESHAKKVDAYERNPSMKAEMTLRYSWYAPWSKLIRNSLVQDNHIRFNSIQYSNDEMFSVQTGFYAKKIAVCTTTIYCVMHHADSLTTTLNKEAFEIRALENARTFQFLKSHLGKRERRAAELYKIAVTQLFTILSRGYGLRYFCKYLRFFTENKMLIFDIRIFDPRNLVRMIKFNKSENRKKKFYYSDRINEEDTKHIKDDGKN